MSPKFRCDFTKALYLVINTSFSKVSCNFCNSPIAWFTLVEVAFKICQGVFDMGFQDNAVIKK